MGTHCEHGFSSLTSCKDCRIKKMHEMLEFEQTARRHDLESAAAWETKYKAVLQRVVDASKVYESDPVVMGAWFIISIQALAHEIESKFEIK
jgi:hypothetical protein